MKFLVMYRQEGGCDYTISCGVRIEEIEARSLEDAYAMVCASLVGPDTDNSYYLRDDTNIIECEVFEFTRKAKINIPELKRMQKEIYSKMKRDDLEEKERKQYELLKAKFEKV